MGLTLQEVLVTALKKLEEPSFQRFVERLSVWEVREEYRNILKDEQTGKDPEHVASLINNYYNYSYGAEVALAVLEEIGEKKVREELQHDLRTVDTSGHGLGTAMYTARVKFIDDHRSDLMRRITDVDPVLWNLLDQKLLTREQYDDVMEKRTPQEKMEKLCDIIRHWEDTKKYTAYTVLRKYYEQIIRDMEEAERMRRYNYSQHFMDRVKFIDDHRSDLMRRIKDLNPVIRDLRDQMLLTQEQYNDVKKKKSQKKMEKLCDIIRHWEDTKKYTAYTVLRNYNEQIIRDLEKEERMRRYGDSQHFMGRDHFVIRYRSHLINDIKEVNLVLDDLRSHNLLTEEQYKDLQAIPTSKEKMSRLCDTFQYESDAKKDQFYISLWRYNYTVIHNLERSEKSSSSKTSAAGDHFIDRHREELIGRIKIVHQVVSDLYSHKLLTKEQRDYIIDTPASEDRMRRLYDVIRYLDDDEKEKVYDALYKYNPRVIDFLIKPRDSSPLDKTGDHFIDRHREELIGRIKIVRPVISDLYSNKLLTREEREYIVDTPASDNMMRRLYDIIRYLDDDGKRKVYDALYKYNPRVIDFLINLRDSSPLDKTGDHFIDRHREELIDRIKIVRPVIDDLYRSDLLTGEEWDYIMETPEPEDRMRRLYDFIRYLDDDGKRKVYAALYKYNPRVIAFLIKLRFSSPLDKTGDHFIDRHREELIDRIRNVRPVIYYLGFNKLLTGEERDYIMKLPESENMMRRLYDIIRHWDDDEKETVYDAWIRYNPNIIAYLINLRDSSSLDKNKVTFIERRRLDLIRRIINVDPVLRDLRDQDLLTQEQYNDVIEKRTPQEKMEKLCDIIRHWEDTEKYTAYAVLRNYNGQIIRDLEYEDNIPVAEAQGSSLPSVRGATSQKTMATNQETTVTCQKTMATSQETFMIKVDEINCKLCGKVDEDLAEVVSTTDSNNRLELKSPGLYRCQKTGIKFEVNRPVIIECKLDSWSDHLKDIEIISYEILGPLFNIKTLGDPNAVSTVYLPHYLCLKGFSGDISEIKCAHFQDGNLTLETPTQIIPYYITLENPVFSLLGVILAIKRKNIKIHGMVLLYFTILGEGESDEEHRIHLYTLPYTTDAEENIDKENKKFGYQRIKKPEHTATVYRKKSYLITGSPGVSVCPKTLEFQAEPYQFTELQLTEKDVTIDLSVSDENTKDPVWETRLTQQLSHGSQL
ncbi:uncharacterized protein [Dendropsophus ebraccatus]|uniref:uncharacterized protein isoform X2 n=1 Tax=Dendropsophus ebraccatus TaxID=150705 RepID=UPI003831712A